MKEDQNQDPTENQIAQIGTLVEIGEIVTDPETGQELIASETTINELLTAETYIKTGLLTISLALKKIRDNKLYLLRGMNSLQDYATNFLSFNYRHAKKILQIADTYGDSPHFEKISQLPMNTLLKADDDLVQQLKEGEFRDSEGNVWSFEEIGDMKNKEMNNELKRLLQQNSSLKKDLIKVKENAEQNQKLVELYESQDGKMLEKVKSRNEAQQIILHSRGALAKAIDDLSRIELTDADIVRDVVGMIGGAIVGLSTIHDEWMPILQAANGVGMEFVDTPDGAA